MFLYIIHNLKKSDSCCLYYQLMHHIFFPSALQVAMDGSIYRNYI